ncbi:hypothetical protein [Bacillus thuringiensis]
MKGQNPEENKRLDIFHPYCVIGLYFLISIIIVLLKLFYSPTNGYFMTTLAILSALFVVVTTWNAKYLSLLIILGGFIFAALQFLPLSDDDISMWNDIIAIGVFNFTIIWVLLINKKKMEEQKHKDYMLSAANGKLYQALEDFLHSDWFHNMNTEEENKFWEALESRHYPGAPRKEDYED